MTTKLTAAIATTTACMLLVAAPAAKDKLFRQKLNKDQEILHALNRLAFGPKPGDIAAVRKLGLKKWVDRQLHPDSIAENSQLDARLKPLDSLAMDPVEMTRRYPPPQFIVAIANGKAPLPSDPEERTRLERLASRYKNKLEKKDASDDVLKPAQKMPLASLLKPGELQTLRKGTPEQRADLLRSIPPDKLDTILFDMPEQVRRGLFAIAPVDIRRKMLLYAAPQQVIAHDLAEAKLYRAVYSNRQLQEVLADFWFNHFNVYLEKGADRFLVTSYEREAIRPHVLGKFKDLLEATAESPAMLFYLDNWQSVANQQNRNRKNARGLNENYARELLELHTLGVDGGYTQKDIIEVARCFTGWTIGRPYQGAQFEFNPRVHDKGEKTVLGVTIPAGGGKEDGLKVLDILVHHPSTARFISRKLAIRFVADNPPESLISAMAATFQKTDGDLRAVMATMLKSKEFWSQGAYRSKMKSPLEMVASSLRATGADMDAAFPIAQRIADLGQPLYRKVEPTGYSNSGEEWMNSASLLGRVNFALALANNKLPGVKVDTSKWKSGDPAADLLFAPPSPQTRDALAKALAEKKEPAALAALVLGSPEFQRR